MSKRVFVFLLLLLSVSFAQANELPKEKNDGIIKILAIGNSFSADAIEENLYDLAKEKNIKTVVANLYIGGAPLSLHVKNAEENKSAYSYRKTSVDGTKTTTPNVSLEAALGDEDWDYISFQQASSLSGQLNTVEESLPALYKYVKSKALNPAVRLVYHQTWAYSVHAVHVGFSNYDRDQQKMYQAIADVSSRVAEIVPIDEVVPAGTAIQNARTSFIGDNFDRDGYHLRLPLGRYVAACAWFEKLFGIPVVGMEYKPEGITQLEKKVAQAAAHAAVRNPYTVTKLTKFKKGPKGLKKPAAPVLVNFAGTSHEGVWNPIISPLEGKIYALKDSLNNPTRITLEMVERFNGRIGYGTSSPTTVYHFPGSVTGNSYFGNTKTQGNGATYPRATFKLHGLDKRSEYDVSFFASRLGDSLGVQETLIICEGAGKGESRLNATDNVSELAYLRAVKPARDGTLTFNVTAGPGNTNPNGLFYLSALRIERKE